MAGNYRYISEQEKKLVITMSLRGMKVKDNNEAFYTEAVVAEVTESPRVDGCLYWDDKVIAFRGRTPRARSAESCCGADISLCRTLPKMDD